MRIDKMTAAQAAQLPEWANKWIEIGLSTEPADFDTATAAALKAYQLCNLTRPRLILRMCSPYAATLGGILAWAMLRELAQHGTVLSQVGAQVWDQVGAQVGDQVRAQVRDQVWAQVRAQVGAQVGDQVWDQVGDQVGDQVRAQVWAQVRDQVWDQVGDQVWDQVGDQVGDQVRAQVWAQVRDQVWDQVRAQVWDQVRDQVGDQVRAQVRAQVRDQVWDQVGDQVRAQVGAQVRDQVGDQVVKGVYNDRGGAFWASWCGYITFIRDVLGWKDPILEKFDIDEQLTRSCGWVWWHENVLAISDRPKGLHRDAQGRLHNESGPSIAYRDGWALYHWHGVSVPEYVIERPQGISVQHIEDEKNMEVRRAMLSRYGQDRFLRDSGAQLVNRDECGLLYRKNLAGDEPLVMVHVLNPTPEPDGTLNEHDARIAFGDAAVDANLSTMQRIGFAFCGESPKFKEYFLRVPPDMRTAREAVAWTFEQDPKRYAPAIQT